MKVCFYLDNKRCSNIDYRNPKKGNPGIGGTEYMIWTISYYLKKIYNDIEIVILAPVIEKLTELTTNIKCNNLEDAIIKSNSINADIFVVRGGVYYDKLIYELIDKLKLKTITWSHNFENYDCAKSIYECNYIKRNICVSKEQYDRLRDHSIFTKSTYIYNALDFDIYNPFIANNKEKEKIVCYLGALKPEKGFHKIAESWSKIEKKVPDAKLYVIGGGNLYDKNAKMGEYNLALESYEKKFIKYITDTKGNIKENIKFFGVIGESDKLQIMRSSKVAIINPVAKDETFCISAVEFQALGIPVVARKRFGLLDTVSNKKTGLLFSTKKQMERQLIHLLNSQDECDKLGESGIEFVREKFDIYNICEKWKIVFDEVVNETPNKLELSAENYSRDLKWLREINRILKKFIKRLPAILDYPLCIYNTKIYKGISKIKYKFIKSNLYMKGE